jgi:pimeloyl-ACP methyl ester carboxylesterase
MTVVLINGNPETPRIWDQLAPLLVDHETVRIGLPGFGVDPPANWNATIDEYIDYVTSELAELDHPVHVLGHDFGGLLALMVAARRPEILKSVAADTFGSFSADYQWHPLAQIWQTPGDGERWVAEPQLGCCPGDSFQERRHDSMTSLWSAWTWSRLVEG